MAKAAKKSDKKKPESQEPEAVRIDVSKLKTVKRWAAEFGIKRTGKPYTPSYAYKLFDDSVTTPAAIEVKENFAIVVIDQVLFVTEKKNLPKTMR